LKNTPRKTEHNLGIITLSLLHIQTFNPLMIYVYKNSNIKLNRVCKCAFSGLFSLRFCILCHLGLPGNKRLRLAIHIRLLVFRHEITGKCENLTID